MIKLYIYIYIFFPYFKTNKSLNHVAHAYATRQHRDGWRERETVFGPGPHAHHHLPTDIYAEWSCLNNQPLPPIKPIGFLQSRNKKKGKTIRGIVCQHVEKPSYQFVEACVDGRRPTRTRFPLHQPHLRRPDVVVVPPLLRPRLGRRRREWECDDVCGGEEIDEAGECGSAEGEAGDGEQGGDPLRRAIESLREHRRREDGGGGFRVCQSAR